MQICATFRHSVIVLWCCFSSHSIEINQMTVAAGISFWPVIIYRWHHHHHHHRHHERGVGLPTHRRVSWSTVNPPTHDAVGRQTYDPTVLTQCSWVLQIGAFDLRRPPAVLYSAHSSVSAAAKQAAASDEAAAVWSEVRFKLQTSTSPQLLVELRKTHDRNFSNPWMEKPSHLNSFLLRPFPFLSDWFHGLSDHLMILLCLTAGFVCMVC